MGTLAAASSLGKKKKKGTKKELTHHREQFWQPLHAETWQEGWSCWVQRCKCRALSPASGWEQQHWANWADTGCGHSGSLSWCPQSPATPHGHAARAPEPPTPREAEESPASAVPATSHPQAMDQRGSGKIRGIHFNFKTWKFRHGRSLKRISSVMFQRCVEGECRVLNIYACLYLFEQALAV